MSNDAGPATGIGAHVAEARLDARGVDSKRRVQGRSYRVDCQPRVFTAIAEPTVNVVIWRRRLAPHCTAELARVAGAGALSEFSGVIHAKRFDPMRVAGELECGRLRSWLAADIRMLVGLFSTMTGRSRVSLSVSVVRDDCCRKFHVDNMRLRLITTYLGPGTEWLDEASVQREALINAPMCPHDANAAVVRTAGKIHRARPGDVLLLKGKRYSDMPGVVHRSPPIENIGVARVVPVASI